MKCDICKAQMELQDSVVDYTIAGFNLRVTGVPTPTCTVCGHKEEAIVAIRGLHTYVAKQIINQIPRPTGEQIKFLRKYMGESQERFHSHFLKDTFDVETVSRWESDLETPDDKTILFMKSLVEEYIWKQNMEYRALVAQLQQKHVE